MGESPPAAAAVSTVPSPQSMLKGALTVSGPRSDVEMSMEYSSPAIDSLVPSTVIIVGGVLPTSIWKQDSTEAPQGVFHLDHRFIKSIINVGAEKIKRVGVEGI